MNTNTLLITDFYKLCHMLQYDERIVQMVSYLTPRKSRLAESHGIDHVVMFGLQAYVESFVVKAFNENFFGRPWESIEAEIQDTLMRGLGYPGDLVDETCDKIHKLWTLGYLPVIISGVSEGCEVPMGVPCVMITSTNDEFPWVGQVLEASLSASIWHPMVSATIALQYRKIAEAAYARTCDGNIEAARSAMCDFSMRGQESVESAVASSAAWLACMYNSSTVYARQYIEENYWNRDSSDGRNLRIAGLTSTEHSVMTSQACIDGGDETNTFKRLFELYKDVSFAAVCDSYDFWNVVDNILPKFKETIYERGELGKFIGIRHDSSEPVFALCGYPVLQRDDYEYREEMDNARIPHMLQNREGLFNLVTFSKDGTRCEDPNARQRTSEEKGLVEALYDIFGGTENSKGFLVLNPGIKAVYGDSITITRAKEIYSRLEKKGFAACNVSLGVGSFSFQAIEDENGNLAPFTRDTFSIAMKCTWARLADGTSINVFKSPKGFDEKKSLKGLVAVDEALDQVAKIVPDTVSEWCRDPYGSGAKYQHVLVPRMDDLHNFQRDVIRGYMPKTYFIGMPSDMIKKHRADMPKCISWFERVWCGLSPMRFNAVRHNITWRAQVNNTGLNRQVSKRADMYVAGSKLYDVIAPHFTEWATSTNAQRFVVGMSGGKDSTVVAMLCAKLFGKANVYGLSLSNDDFDTPVSLGEQVSKLIGISCPDINIGGAVEEITDRLHRVTSLTQAATINLPCRMRMTTLFAYGQCIDGRVINTSNLSEDTVGYATQFGDNAGCYAPIQNLTVTEVKQLGVYLACELGIADEMEPWINKVPTDGLQPKTDEDNLGFKYADLDKLIRTGEGTDELKEKVMRMYKANRFKTEIVNMPKPTFDLPNYIVKWYAEENEEGVKPW